MRERIMEGYRKVVVLILDFQKECQYMKSSNLNADITLISSLLELRFYCSVINYFVIVNQGDFETGA